MSIRTATSGVNTEQSENMKGSSPSSICQVFKVKDKRPECHFS